MMRVHGLLPLLVTLGCHFSVTDTPGPGTDIPSEGTFTITLPARAESRSVWLYFDHAQEASYFELVGDLTVAPTGFRTLTFPLRITANHFVQSAANPCRNPTGQGPGRCVSSESVRFRDLAREVNGRTWLFDLPATWGPVTITGRIHHELGPLTVPRSLQILITS